jgi:hypothetical protein
LGALQPSQYLVYRPLLSRSLANTPQGITSLLRSAGLALQTLTASQIQTDSQPSILESKRTAFQASANAYLRTLQTVDVHLQRQILGLEEAEIVTKETPKPRETMTAQEMQKQAAGQAGGGGKEVEKIGVSINEGSLGKLDTGWLNSKSGRVGWKMEAELWEKARIFLEIVADGDGDGKGERGESMEDAGEMDMVL